MEKVNASVSEVIAHKASFYVLFNSLIILFQNVAFSFVLARMQFLSSRSVRSLSVKAFLNMYDSLVFNLPVSETLPGVSNSVEGMSRTSISLLIHPLFPIVCLRF